MTIYWCLLQRFTVQFGSSFAIVRHRKLLTMNSLVHPMVGFDMLALYIDSLVHPMYGFDMLATLSTPKPPLPSSVSWGLGSWTLLSL